MEIKSIAFKVKASNSGEFDGYASRFNEIDNGRDTVSPGAFKNSISNHTPELLHQHENPVGKILDIYEDNIGLFMKGKILDINEGKEILNLMVNGVIDGLSIGFNPQRYTIDMESDTRTLHKIDLREVSIVSSPMQETARVLSIKSKFCNEDYHKDLKMITQEIRNIAKSI